MQNFTLDAHSSTRRSPERGGAKILGATNAGRDHLSFRGSAYRPDHPLDSLGMSQDSSNRRSKARVKVRGHAQVPADPGFAEIVTLIQAAKERAYHAVNTALIDLYWQVGEYISRKLAAAEWGDGVVTQLAAHLANTQPGLRGFTRPNLFRMRQFYEAYRDNEKVAPLVRQRDNCRGPTTSLS